MPVLDVTACYYCGEPADTVDHARPQSLDRALRTMDVADRALVIGRQPRRDLVPACRDCNCVLGKLWFATLEERRNYVKRRLRERNARLLSAPVWEQDEIEELGPTLKTTIVSQQRRKAAVERRLRWPS